MTKPLPTNTFQKTFRTLAERQALETIATLKAHADKAGSDEAFSLWATNTALRFEQGTLMLTTSMSAERILTYMDCYLAALTTYDGTSHQSKKERVNSLNTGLQKLVEDTLNRTKEGEKHFRTLFGLFRTAKYGAHDRGHTERYKKSDGSHLFAYLCGAAQLEPEKVAPTPKLAPEPPDVHRIPSKKLAKGLYVIDSLAVHVESPQP